MLPDAAPHMSDFGISWAVFGGMTIPITVCALLFQQAHELLDHGVGGAGLLLQEFLVTARCKLGKEFPGHSRLFLIIDLNPQMVGFWGFGVLGFWVF